MTDAKDGTEFVILLAEDNVADAELMRVALRRAGVACRLHVTRDGEETLDFLTPRDPSAGLPTPGLILLDLNMPGMGGRKVIEELLGHDHLQRVPLVVLTGAPGEADCLQGWDPQRCLYRVKPPTFRELIDIVREIMDFLTVLESDGQLPASK